MAVTAKGWQYVLPTDTLTSYPTTSQAIANLAEAVVPFAMAAGSVAVGNPTANAGLTVAVTFPVGRFSQVPIVVTSPDSNAYLAGSTGSPTTAGVNIRVYAFAAPPTGVNAKWWAVQMTPSASGG